MTAQPPLFDDGMTLGEAKDWLRDRLDEGARCPCCDQFAKVYKRRIHATMARELIIMYRASEAGEYVYLPALLDTSKHGGDTIKMVFWGLIEEDTETVPKNGAKRAGWWRLTDRGRRFVLGFEPVPKYARVYDGRCLGFEGEHVTITDALGAKFDYQLLMQGLA